MAISPRYVVNRPSVIFDVQGGETVIINLVVGHYFRLGSESTPLWLRFDQGASVDDLLASCENPDELRPEVDRIVAELAQAELIAASADATPTASGWCFGGFDLEQFTDLEDILGLDPVHEVDPARGWPYAAEA